MTETRAKKWLDVLDPRRDERGLINFDRPGSVTVNIDRALRSQQERAEQRQIKDQESGNKNEAGNAW